MINQILKTAVYGLPHLLDYLPPPELTVADCQPGARVAVPVGNTIQQGMIIEHAPPGYALDKIKNCKALLDTQPLLDAQQLELLRWSSDYYLSNLPGALSSLLPKPLRQGQAPGVGYWQMVVPLPAVELDRPTAAQSNRSTATGANHTPAVRLNSSPDPTPPRAPATNSKLSQAQASALALFAQDGLLAAAQLHASGVSSSTLASLHRRGLIEPGDGALIPLAKTRILLNQAQREAAERILAHPGYACTLLYGVTSSGKTQVYLQLARQVLQAGKQVLLLVPEIGLTPQTLARFKQHFAGQIAVLHSGLSERERSLHWQAIHQGQLRLIIGTRSALWAPCHQLGLIVVDEEHDNSFKQQQGRFRYNARDLALMRAKLANCPVVLGTATPQLSTIRLVERKKIGLIRLNERAKSIPMPHIALVDMRGVAPQHYLAPASLTAIQEQLTQHKQVLVFLNRRGFAPLLQCQLCGWQALCCNCDSRMTLHRFPSGLCCHHCGDRQSIPQTCPACGCSALNSLGSGTQHIAGALQRYFPHTKVVRIDRDSVGHKGKLELALQGTTRREPLILVGTQMLAKGHDFAHLGLVVVLEADSGLFSSDFRAPEVTLQLLIQVAGRAGRSSEQGQVLVQTTQPDAQYFTYLCDSDYDGLARLLLSERRSHQLPPYNSLVLMRAQHRDQSRLEKFMRTANQQLAGLSRMDRLLRVHGPAPPALGRLAGVWQEQFLLFHPQRASLHKVCHQWKTVLGKIKPTCKWYFDVDPYEVL